MKISVLFAALLCSAPILLPTTIVQAQTASTAGLETIKLPKGSESYPYNTAPLSGLLKDLAKDKDVRRTPTGSEVQALIWRGENYNSERVSIVKMAVRSALIEAGFAVKDVEGARDRVQIFGHFDANDTQAPFYPNAWALPTYFSANNAATGNALVGVWVESNNALVLAMLPVTGEKKAGASPTTRPASSLAPLQNAIQVTEGNDAMKSAQMVVTPVFTPLARKPGMVRGEIKDGGGRPIAGATVSVQAGALGGFTTQHTARSNAQGVYEVAVPVGLCRVSAAWCHIKYNGVTYALPLQSADGNLEQFDNRRGHTENFVLRVSGKTGKSGSDSDFKSYYGGSLRISRTSSIQKGGTLEVTLVPQGPLLNGSIGRPIVYRTSNDDYEATLNNIPLGRYKASVKLIDGDIAAPVQVEKFPTNKIGSSVIVDFEPVTSNQPDFGYCPVRQFHISLHP